MIKLDSTPGRTAMANGKAYLFFSGYAYLGIHCVDAFNELTREGIERYGMLYPSSRISNSRLSLYDEFENSLTTRTGMEETVSFSSGYLAAMSAASLVSGENIYIAPGSHPSLAGSQKVLPANFEIWCSETIDKIEKSKLSRVAIITDSVNIMESKINDFSFLKSINSEVEVICVIDDSHGIGIIGKNGNGINSYLPKGDNLEYILTYSLSKAFSLHGGAVSCSAERATQLRSAAAYTGSTAINPALAYAFIHAEDLYAEQRASLSRNIKIMDSLIDSGNIITHGKGLPIFILPGHSRPGYFTDHNIIISSFAYPSPVSPIVNRLIVNALHTVEDLEKCADIVRESLQENQQ